MAEEGFQGYHVRQQSRRDNLRATLQNNNPQPPNNSLFTPTLTMTSAPTTAATGFSFHSHAPTSDPPFVLPLFSDSHDYDAVSLHTELIRSSAPLGPFTGYASILKRSRYLNPAQQLLEDFCRPGRSDSDPPQPNYLNRSAKDPINSTDRLDVQLKNSRLTLMLEEVYKRYKLYCQQMELAVASFETIDGLGNAAPYISFAIKSILKHFGCLKNAILDRLQSKAEKTSYDDDFTQNPNGLNLSNKNLRQSVLRPQRGLPENAVAVLRAWLFEHFLHPYPSDSEKQMLAQQTGLSRTQVSNWFINSRVRIWKPMVEEIHGLETQQAQTTCLYDNPLHLGLTTSSRNARDTQEKCSNNNEHRNFSEQSDDRMMQRGNTGYHGSLTISNDLESHEVSLALSLQAKK